jgi:hypothetical protein
MRRRNPPTKRRRYATRWNCSTAILVQLDVRTQAKAARGLKGHKPSMMTEPNDFRSASQKPPSLSTRPLGESRHPRLPCPSGKTAATISATPPVKPHFTQYSTLPKFGFDVQTTHPGPRQGADRDRHEPRAGQRWTRRRRVRSALQGGFGCEQWLSCLRHDAESVFAWPRV